MKNVAVQEDGQLICPIFRTFNCKFGWADAGRREKIPKNVILPVIKGNLGC